MGDPLVFAVRNCQICGAKLQDTVIRRNESPDMVLKEIVNQSMDEVKHKEIFCIALFLVRYISCFCEVFGVFGNLDKLTEKCLRR